MTAEIRLRDTVPSDFSIFCALQADPLSSKMAAFGTKDADADALAERWRRAASDAAMTLKTIVEEEKVVGFVASFAREGKPQVTYWVARSHWGRGIATAALAELLALVTARPIYASAAEDNAGSLRVLEKCGFTRCGSAKAFADARREEIVEIFPELIGTLCVGTSDYELVISSDAGRPKKPPYLSHARAIARRVARLGASKISARTTTPSRFSTRRHVPAIRPPSRTTGEKMPFRVRSACDGWRNALRSR